MRASVEIGVVLVPDAEHPQLTIDQALLAEELGRSSEDL
jgi:hypothetical protein